MVVSQTSLYENAVVEWLPASDDKQSDDKQPDDKLSSISPPPPYVDDPDSGSGYNSEKVRPPPESHSAQKKNTAVQKEGEVSKSKTRILERIVSRLASPVTRNPKSETQPARAATKGNIPLNAAKSETQPARAATEGNVPLNAEVTFPRWNGHNGMTSGHGISSTKLAQPLAPRPRTLHYSLDILFCPPPLPFASETARWQQARLSFVSNDLFNLREPIPWRANLEDCCSNDSICFINSPYPVPFFLDQSSGKIKAYNITPHSSSVGGHTYERHISLDLKRNQRNWPAGWCFSLSLTSRDGAWLASLSRADTAALVGLDSAMR